MHGKRQFAVKPAVLLGSAIVTRYLSVTPKAGQGNWSQPLSLLVK